MALNAVTKITDFNYWTGRLRYSVVSEKYDADDINRNMSTVHFDHDSVKNMFPDVLIATVRFGATHKMGLLVNK